MSERITLRNAVELLNIDCNTAKNSVNICCPICAKNEREKKMNLNLSKDVFRCPKCNTAGNALTFWALFRNINPNDVSNILKDYRSFISKGDNPSKMNKIKYKEVPQIESTLVDVNIRHKTYTALLEMLSLNSKHRRNLKERGLDDATINQNMYKSYPVTAYKEICNVLLNKGLILEGVPGFYLDNDGQWTLVPYGQYTGFLIPQRDGFGRIQGMQIRFDNPKSNRYSTLSSIEREKGTGAKAYCHFSMGRKKKLNEIILTEGPLKGDIISYFTGESVIAMQGVNSVKTLESALTDLRIAGTEKIIIAFDMDIYTNEYVKTALENIKNILEQKGFDYQTLLWDKEEKGLDDWLLKNRTLSRG